MESRFKEDMNMDSLDQIELMMLVEDEFGEIFFHAACSKGRVGGVAPSWKTNRKLLSGIMVR